MSPNFRIVYGSTRSHISGVENGGGRGCVRGNELRRGGKLIARAEEKMLRNPRWKVSIRTTFQGLRNSEIRGMAENYRDVGIIQLSDVIDCRWWTYDNWSEDVKGTRRRSV